METGRSSRYSLRCRSTKLTADSERRDLVVLVADKNMEFAVKGLLCRDQALGIRPSISFEVWVHPERDPGCLLRAHDLLRQSATLYSHALVMLDHDGCGKEKTSRDNLEEDLEERLSANGWGDRAAAVVIDPELEAWVWGDPVHVGTCLDWRSSGKDLGDWLVEKGFAESHNTKPANPKKAFKQALWTVKMKRSSSIYRQVAELADFSSCTDSAFQKFLITLQGWFPEKQ